jgi:hypothetical protein
MDDRLRDRTDRTRGVEPPTLNRGVRIIDLREKELDPRCPRLVEALLARGVPTVELISPVESSSPTTCLTVVLLDPGPDKVHDPLAPMPQQISGEVAPLVFGNAPSKLLSNDSQIVRPLSEFDAAVDAIAVVARFGGSTLIVANRLATRAERWDRDGRLPSDLLDEHELHDSLPALNNSRPFRPERSDVVSAYLAASQARLRMRRRRSTTTLLIVSLILILSTTGALIARTRAVRASEDAIHQAAASNSARLVRQAVTQLTPDPDPDLPLLLLDAAIRANASPDAFNATRHALELIPVHRSTKLPLLPAAVAAARDGSVFAVTYMDHSADLRDAAGRLEQHFQPDVKEKQIPIPVVSADGKHIALIGTTVRMIRGSTSETPALPEASRAFVGAWYDGTLQIVTTQGPYAVSADGKLQSAAWARASGLGGIVAGSFSAQRAEVALADGRNVWVGEMTTGKTVYASPSAGVTDVELSADGQLLFITKAGGQTSEVSLGPSPSPHPAEISSGDVTTSATGDLTLVQTTNENVCPVTSNGVPTACWVAHRGGTGRPAPFGASSVATVGADGYLRIWADIHQPIYLDPAWTGGFDIQLANPAYRAARRSLIGVDPASNTGTVFDQMEGRLATFNLATLTPRQRGFIALPSNYQLALSPNGRWVAHLWKDAMYVVDASTMRAAWDSKQIPVTGVPSIGSGVLTALSNDGSTFAAATDARLIVWHQGRPPTWSATKGSPSVAIAIDEADNVRSIDQQGRVTLVPAKTAPSASPTGTPPNDPTPSPSGRIEEPSTTGMPTAIAAAALGATGVAAWATDDGVVSQRVDHMDHVLMSLSRTFHPYALKFSPDDARLAVFGNSETVIVDAATGVILLHSYATSPDSSVQDVAFLNGDQALLLSRDGGLDLRKLDATDDLTSRLRSALPRDPTPEEKLSFGLMAVGSQY